MTLTCEQVRELAPSFVLGALEPGEQRAVRDHLGTCPEVHDELSALGGVVAHLADSVDLVEPPPGLRRRVLAAAGADLAASSLARPAVASVARPAVAGVARPAVAGVARPAFPSVARPLETRSPPPAVAPAVLRRQPWVRPTWLVGLAAALAIVLLGAWNLGLQAALSDARTYRAHVDEVLAIARTPGASVAVLVSPVPGANSGLMAVAADGRAAAVVSGLPATSGSEVYEIWVIAGSDAPRPIAAMNQSGTIAFLSGTVGRVPPGATLALTREPAPNPTTPTLPILSKGVATTSS